MGAEVGSYTENAQLTEKSSGGRGGQRAGETCGEAVQPQRGQKTASPSVLGPGTPGVVIVREKMRRQRPQPFLLVAFLQLVLALPEGGALGGRTFLVFEGELHLDDLAAGVPLFGEPVGV